MHREKLTANVDLCNVFFSLTSLTIVPAEVEQMRHHIKRLRKFASDDDTIITRMEENDEAEMQRLKWVEGSASYHGPGGDDPCNLDIPSQTYRLYVKKSSICKAHATCTKAKNLAANQVNDLVPAECQGMNYVSVSHKPCKKSC